ncbi:MAG: hypothetical protein AB1664_04215 [Thermodesulfobacteriota bacterium]
MGIDRSTDRKMRVGLVAVSLCVLWLTGCIPFLFGSKETPSEKNPPSQSGKLIKPKLENDSASVSPPKESLTAKDREPRSAPATEREFDTDEPPKPASVGSAKLPPKTEAATAGDASGAEEKKEKPGRADPGIKKHDHAAYKRQLKNKAIDIVNNETKCSLARLCKDYITEEWTLTLFTKGDKTFSFTSHVWDPIAEKWKQTFTSKPRPIKNWATHLRVTSSGWECEVLKGRE